MQCNCISDTEKAMTERAQSKHGATAKAQCKGTAFIVTDDLDVHTAFVIPFNITADKPGYRKGKVMDLVANYCPICGLSVKPPKTANPAPNPAPSPAEQPAT